LEVSKWPDFRFLSALTTDYNFRSDEVFFGWFWLALILLVCSAYLRPDCHGAWQFTAMKVAIRT